MANLIQNNSKLVELQKNQTSQTDNPGSLKQNEDSRNPKTVRIIKDQSGFGFNVRGQISGMLKFS